MEKGLSVHRHNQDHLPFLEIGFTAQRTSTGAVRASIWTLDRDGERLKLNSWAWPSGRPTPDQERDVLATLTQELGASIVSIVGIQGVLME